MSVNEARILGRLGADPDLRHTQNGNAVCNMRVATSEYAKDKNGNKTQRTEWHTVVAWSRLAENCAKFLAKGRQVYVEGKLETRPYEKNGVKCHATQIVARVVQFLDYEREKHATKNSEPNGNTKDMFDQDYAPTVVQDYAVGDIPF